jgi:hypothetical protein
MFNKVTDLIVGATLGAVSGNVLGASLGLLDSGAASKQKPDNSPVFKASNHSSGYI